MPWHILHIGYIGVATLPFQVAEITTSAYGTADAGVIVEYRHYNGIVVGDKIHHSHNTIATCHTHVFLHTVLASTVDGHEVVVAVNGVAYHLGRYQLVSAQEFQFIALSYRCVFCQVVVQPRKLVYLTLKIEIAQREVFVDLGEREERLYGRFEFV